MVNLVFTHLLLTATSPEVVFSGQMVHLTPVADPVVIRSGDHRALVRNLPDARLSRLLDRFTVIEGAPSVARQLVRNGDAEEVLAVYETDDGHRLFADRHVRVRFDASVDALAARHVVTAAGGASPLVKNSARNEYDVLAASPEESLEVSAKLRASPGVLWSHPDFIVQVEVLAAATDPLYVSSYHHAILNSAAAWDITRGTGDSRVAVLDSGTDLSHPEFANKVVDPYDFLDNNADPDPSRNDAHGTACSGIATALADNGLGIAGVCPGCSLMPIRMLDENGFTRSGGAADAITWAIDHGARAISCSWSLSPVPDSLTDALASADSRGAIILYASGNAGTTIQDTDIAANRHVHAVGATDQYDLIASYSNTGSHLFITAPSPNVVTDISTDRGYANGAYYTSFAGTSGSTPVVAGLVGLILSVSPGLTNTEVVNILASTADQIGTDPYVVGRNDTYGAGRVSSYRALLVAANRTACPAAVEDCTNGIDDDCDALIDALDPQCAPAALSVGVPCTVDFQCSERGFCLNESLGYASGYCTASCGGSGAADCPGGTVCIGEGYATGSQCHASCEDDTSCRAGYWCRSFENGDKACMPSCETSGCLPSEICDSATKTCLHQGPSPLGGACNARTDCAENGRCLSDQGGFHGGFCVTECQDDGVCDNGGDCFVVGAGTAFCLPSCSLAEDCREFYACYPVTANGVTTGYCYSACLTDEECSNGDTCNAYGLCGNEQPPGVSAPLATGSSSQGGMDGCAATGGSSFAALIVALVWLRRADKHAKLKAA
ncbi:MAG: S8 family serine peptidase [Clostridia bacterium]|nr:S8 family serine peptidase [Deltaproteobacteria bacterium]